MPHCVLPQTNSSVTREIRHINGSVNHSESCNKVLAVLCMYGPIYIYIRFISTVSCKCYWEKVRLVPQPNSRRSSGLFWSLDAVSKVQLKRTLPRRNRQRLSNDSLNVSSFHTHTRTFTRLVCIDLEVTSSAYCRHSTSLKPPCHQLHNSR